MGSIGDDTSAVWIDARKRLNKHAGSRIFGKRIAVSLYIVPKKTVPHIAPLALWVVAHASYVGAGRNVGLRSHTTQVAELTYAIDVRNEHPVIRIDE